MFRGTICTSLLAVELCMIVARQVGFTCEISSSARLVSTFATFGCSVKRIASQMAIERSYRGAAVSYCPCERAAENEGEFAIALRRQLAVKRVTGYTRNLYVKNGVLFAAKGCATPRTLPFVAGCSHFLLRMLASISQHLNIHTFSGDQSMHRTSTRERKRRRHQTPPQQLALLARRCVTLQPRTHVHMAFPRHLS